MDAIRKQYSSHQQPLLAAVKASQAEAVFRSNPGVLGSLADAAFFLDAEIHWKTGKQFGTPTWWATDKLKANQSQGVSHADDAAKALYDSFNNPKCTHEIP